MLVPPHIVRTKGPIVAIAASPDDPSIHTAAAIAIAAKEELVIVDACEAAIDDSHIYALASELDLPIKHVIAGKILRSHPAALLPAFRQLQERLVVMTRGVFAYEVASTTASVRQVPMLIVEPPEIAAKAAGSS